MVVEELVTVLGFKTKGVGDIDKARKAYEAFMKSLKSRSVNVTANVGKATGLFSVQGRELQKNKKVVDSLARSTERLGAATRQATLSVTGLARGYDNVARAAARARTEIARTAAAQRSFSRSGGGLAVPVGSGRGGSRRSTRSNLLDSTAIVAPRVRRSSQRRPYGSGIGVNDLGPVAGAVGAYEAAEAYNRAAAFDRRLTMIGQTADATRPEIDKLGASLHELAQGTATPVDKLAGGLEALVAQGRNLKEALEFLPSVAKTAAATGSEVDDIAKTADSVGSNFEIAGKQMQTAFDIMAAGGKAGQFELKDMSRYLPSLSPAAKPVGFNGTKGLADIVAMLQIIRKGTGSAEEAATSLTNIFSKLESEETVKNFKEMGVDLEAAMKKGRKEGANLIEVLEEATQKATKGDLSLIPKLFKDQEYARGIRALMTYRGQWQKLSADIQATSFGSVAKDLVRVTQDSQAALDRLDNSWQRFTQSLSRLADAGGVSKGLGDTGKEFEQIAQALERINAAYEKGGLKGALGQIGSDVAESIKNQRRDALPGMKEAQDKHIADLEADIAGTERTMRGTGRSQSQIDGVLRSKRAALAAAKRARGDLDAESNSLAPKSPLRMGQDPTAPISGQPGQVGIGTVEFNKAYPLDLNPPRPIQNAPLPPSRPGSVGRGINTIEDILGPQPMKPQVDTSDVEKAKTTATEAGSTMQTSLNGNYHPTVDISSITAATAAAQTFAATMRGVATAGVGAVKAAAATPAGRTVAASGSGARGGSAAGAGTMTASLRREMGSGTQVAKLARAAGGRGGVNNSVGAVTVNVAQTNASPREIGKATQDSLSRRLARSWSVTAPEPTAA